MAVVDSLNWGTEHFYKLLLGEWMQVVLLNLQDGLISSAHRSTFFYDTVDVMSQLECRFAAALGVKGEEIGSRRNCEIVVKHPLDRTCTLCRPPFTSKMGTAVETRFVQHKFQVTI